MGRSPVFQWVQSERGPWSAKRRAKAWPISHEVALKTLSFLCDKEYERSGEDFSKDFTTLKERVSKFPPDRFALTLVCSYDGEE
jgi:hypothetical protein